MRALPLSGLNLNRNQTGQSGPYCKLRPTRVPYECKFNVPRGGRRGMVGHFRAPFEMNFIVGKGLLYAPHFILLARFCMHASSFVLLARIRVCFIVLIDGIHHHSVGPCLQLGEPSERHGPLDYPMNPCLSST